MSVHSIHPEYSSPSVSESERRSRAESEHQSSVEQPHEAANASGSAPTESPKEYRSDAELPGNSAPKEAVKLLESRSESSSESEPHSPVNLKPAVLRRVPGIRNLRFTAAQQQLRPHLEQRKTDREALSKWNINAEGRNQGVVHLLDYAKARPSNLSLSTKKDFTHKTRLSGEQYDALSEADRSGRRSFTRQGLTDPNKDYKLTNDQVNTLVKKGYLEPLDTPERAKAKSEVDKAQGELTALIKQKMEELKKAGVLEKDFGKRLNEFKKTDNSYLKKSKELSQAKAKQEAVTHYTTTTDQSKRSRLKLIAKAGGKEGFERGKEIEGATRIVSDLIENKENLKETEKRNPPASLKDWRRTGKGKWEEQEIPQSDLKYTATAGFGGKGLTVRTWGTLDHPNADPSKHAGSLGISTVMGGESSEHKVAQPGSPKQKQGPSKGPSKSASKGGLGL